VRATLQPKHAFVAGEVMVLAEEQVLPAQEYIFTKPAAVRVLGVVLPAAVIWHCGAPTATTLPDEDTLWPW